MTIGDAPEVPEGKTHEETLRVFVFGLDGKILHTVERERLRAVNLQALAVAFVDDEGNTHRCSGLPLELVTRETAILRPV